MASASDFIKSVSIPAEGSDGGETAALVIIFVSCVIGLCFAAYQYWCITKIDLTLPAKYQTLAEPILAEPKALALDGTNGDAVETPKPVAVKRETTQEKLVTIAAAISSGANSFLRAEYSICLIFLALFSILVVCLVGSANHCNVNALLISPSTNENDLEGSCWPFGGLTMTAFIIGGLTSMSCGYIGMTIAVYTNVRTAAGATKGWTQAFNAAFRGGAVMGFALASLGLLVLTILILIYRTYSRKHFDDADVSQNTRDLHFKYLFLFEAIAGYGLGGSSIALFGRVGGGIYTKAADVGADLVGKVEKNIPEDDPRNPATIADNVGDNVGDIAGMGADLFGSFAESTCAALVLSAKSLQLQQNFGSILFPLVISAVGIVVCALTSFVATFIDPVKKETDVERVLKIQLILSTVVLTPIHAALAYAFLPTDFCFQADQLASISALEFCEDSDNASHWWGAFVSIACGLWTGLFTGLITEYYTSHSYAPVRQVAESSNTGAATVIIYGLALGYKSVILPVLLLALTIFASFYLCGLYGVALAALGMLSSMSIGLTIDGYGPITDNAGGIAEMAELGKDVRHITDALDAAGNTTAAIGKGFAIGSAALVSLALFGAFISTAAPTTSVQVVNVLEPLVFAFLLIGAMLPYAFTALTMKSVGIAAKAMVEEVRRQFREIPGIMTGEAKPEYERCVEISTKASLKEMILPGALVMLSPILTGYIFGVFALSGLLSGALVSAVQMALSQSNTGGAWDNSKKFIEKGNYGGKGSENHKAAVVGDTVGDPLKDTSGPALNILMKLMAIISVVFANSFANHAAPDGKSWAGY